MHNLSKYVFFVCIFSLLLLLIIGCSEKEEEDGWDKCHDCTVGSWLGVFSGTCDYFNYNSNLTQNDLPITIEISETAPEYLEVKISVPQYYNSTIYGDLISSPIISFAGSGSSVTSTLYKNGQSLKITGNSKKYHYESDTLVMEEVVNFELLKN